MNTETHTSAPTAAQLDAKVAGLSYEEARGKLVEIVSRLEQGNIPLEESLTLWELGEALARRCEAWLDGARKRLSQAQAKGEASEKTDSASSAPTARTPAPPAAPLSSTNSVPDSTSPTEQNEEA